jgi:hypothetical protein
MFSEPLLQAAFSSHRLNLLPLKEWIYALHWQMWGLLRCWLAFEQKNQLVLELEVWKVHQWLFEWQMLSWASSQTMSLWYLVASVQCHALEEHSPFSHHWQLPWAGPLSPSPSQSLMLFP